MRTSVEVDGALLDEARRAAGLRTDEETVEEALRVLARLHRQAEILGLAGKVRRESTASRADKPVDGPRR